MRRGIGVALMLAQIAGGKVVNAAEAALDAPAALVAGVLLGIAAASLIIIGVHNLTPIL